MRESKGPFVTLGPQFRVIAAAFYSAPNPRRAGVPWPGQQPADDLAFERIVNVPKRGLGDAAVKQRTTMPQAPHPAARSRARLVGTDEFKPKPRGALREW